MRSFLRWLPVAIALLLAGWWAKAYWIDGREAHSNGAYSWPAVSSSQAVTEAYRQEVEPILRAKCFQCHTDTDSRPFFTAFPVIGPRLAGPYVEDVIAHGRVHFDFSAGLPSARLAAAMEFAQDIRDVALDDSMPPLEYGIARPASFLSDEEREIFVRWADRASVHYWTALDEAGPGRAPLGRAGLVKLAEAIIAACPVTHPADERARQQCGVALASLRPLGAAMRDPILWGQQRNADDFAFAHIHSTRFSPRVWRNIYAPVFMYGPGYQVVEEGDQMILRLPVRFRSELGAGSYPYPFWHDTSKWQDYTRASELLVIVRDGTIAGIMRGHGERQKNERDAPTPSWDGRWHWLDAEDEPQPAPAMLYTNVLSPDNPYLEPLDAAYRELALALRDESCMECHSPDNRGGMEMLELLNYPNQALTARNRIVTTLERNEMPPIRGIEDPARRRALTDLARRFQATANQALLYEDDYVEDRMDIGWVSGS